jgi:hypothetical protein
MTNQTERPAKHLSQMRTPPSPADCADTGAPGRRAAANLPLHGYTPG